jgi:hypothetical protein
MFADAQMREEQTPDSFHLPTAKILNNIIVGSLLKVCYKFPPGFCPSGERFWVIAEAIQNDTITGKIDSKVLWAPFFLGQTITFEKRNVFDVDNSSPLGVVVC